MNKINLSKPRMEITTRILSNVALILFFSHFILKTVYFLYNTKLRASWGQTLEFAISVFNTDFILALFTVLYVIFTYLLFLSSKKQIDVIEKQIEENRKPILIVKLEPFGANGTALKIQNVGKGNAYDVFVSYQLRKNSNIILNQKWAHTLLQPTEFVRLVLYSDKSYIYFLKEFDEFEYSTTCYGDDQNIIKFPKTILILKKYLDYLQGDKWVIETTIGDDIHKIAKELEHIKKLIDKKNKK